MLNGKLSPKRTALCGMALVLAAGATVSSRRIQGSNDAVGALTHSSIPVVAPTENVQGQDRLIRTIRVFIHPEDIYPGSVVVKPGKIDLVIENETQAEVSLVVERVNPGQSRQSVTALRTVNRLKRNRQELTLGAGVYAFYEESRPQQQGKIIVDPQDR